jgi:hypothetical protein
MDRQTETEDYWKLAAPFDDHAQVKRAIRISKFRFPSPPELQTRESVGQVKFDIRSGWQAKYWERQGTPFGSGNLIGMNLRICY